MAGKEAAQIEWFISNHLACIRLATVKSISLFVQRQIFKSSYQTRSALKILVKNHQHGEKCTSICEVSKYKDFLAL